MPPYEFGAQRLFVESSLEEGARLPLSPQHFNYLLNVLRLRAGDRVLVFNGRDGEWRANIVDISRRQAALAVCERLRAQDAPTDLDYCFAPIKQARLDYMAQKATEMGASRLQPVITRRTQARRVNLGRMRANAIEAAEQCGVLCVPSVAAETDFGEFLASFPAQRLLVFCDEEEEVADPVAALLRAPAHAGVSVLIGPEGGFDEAERAALRLLPNVTRLSLGPRILRADTAAVAALALIQAVLGDWRRS